MKLAGTRRARQLQLARALYAVEAAGRHGAAALDLLRKAAREGD